MKVLACLCKSLLRWYHSHHYLAWLYGARAYFTILRQLLQLYSWNLINDSARSRRKIYLYYITLLHNSYRSAVNSLLCTMLITYLTSMFLRNHGIFSLVPQSCKRLQKTLDLFRWEVLRFLVCLYHFFFFSDSSTLKLRNFRKFV